MTDICDNVEKYDTAIHATYDYVTCRMRFAWWIPNTTDTHSEYLILTVFARHVYTNTTQR